MLNPNPVCTRCLHLFRRRGHYEFANKKLNKNYKKCTRYLHILFTHGGAYQYYILVSAAPIHVYEYDSSLECSMEYWSLQSLLADFCSTTKIIAQNALDQCKPAKGLTFLIYTMQSHVQNCIRSVIVVCMCLGSSLHMNIRDLLEKKGTTLCLFSFDGICRVTMNGFFPHSFWIYYLDWCHLCWKKSN